MTVKVEIVPYDPKWPEIFGAEALLIQKALGPNCLDIYHIGSTAIPGLRAKPVIDILPVVKDIQAVDLATKTMESLGYQAKGENGMAFRRYFQKGNPSTTHHIHVYEEGDPEIDRYLKFRDWMRLHKEDREAYEKLKVDLALSFRNDILSYCSRKGAFVATIDAKDGFDGWRMVQALTPREWKAVNSLRERHTSEELTKKKDHIHFVFYKNAAIIGYAHLQLLEERQATLHLLVIDENYRHQGFGEQFLTLCKRWLQHQGFTAAKTPKSPS